MSWGNKNDYYIYDAKELKVSKGNFRRYIIPQARIMLREYYYILKKMNHLQEYLFRIRKKVISINSDFKEIEKGCEIQDQRYIDGCIEQVKDLYHKVGDLDSYVLSFESKKIKFIKSLKKGEHNSLISLIPSIERLSLKTYELLSLIENFLIITNMNYISMDKMKDRLRSNIHDITIKVRYIQLFLIEKQLQGNFDSVWVHFFWKLEKYIVLEKRSDYLLQRLENLNSAWNTFHMKMMKGNYRLPKGISSFIKKIHIRWNSILKVILRG